MYVGIADRGHAQVARSRVAMVMFAASALPVLGVGPAFGQTAASVQCGAVLTTNTTLTADLVNCAGNGLVVGADDITLNLNGHTVRGDGTPASTGFDYGILVPGHRQVTVTNGSVEGFDRGVLLDASPGGVVTALNVHDNSNRGIMLTDGSGNGRVEGNVSADNGASAIAVVSSDDAVVTRNRSLRNPGGSGVRLEGASRTTITHNILTSNGSGVDLGDGSNDNQVSYNTMNDDHEAGVGVGFSDRNVVTHNSIVRSGSGVILESSDNTTITDNQILHSVGPDGIGIQIYGNNNLVARNTVIDSIRYGIEVDDFQDPGHSPATGTVLRDNTVEGGAEGIAIGPEAGGVVLNTLIEHNTATGALDDGIQLIGPSTGLETSTITRNVAVHNGDLGIETVPGTIDGGNNHAAGNGNPLQCLNITCH